MTTPSDNDLHEAIRRGLAGHQPVPKPGDWKRFQARLRRRRWGRAAGIAGLALLFLGFAVLMHSAEEESEKGVLRTGKPIFPEKVTPESSPGCTPAREETTVVARKTTSAQTLDYVAQAVSSQENRRTPLHPPAPTERQLLVPLAGKAASTLPVSLSLNRAIVALNPVEQEIIQQVVSGKFGDDSTSFRALERNKARWKNAVLVCDATTSMYPYLTQLLAWFRKNERNTGVKGLVLYTDCDSLGRQTDGSTPGKFFVSRRRDVASLLPLLLAAARNTTANADRDENAAEALLFAQRHFPDAQTLVLVADGQSGIKDTARLGSLTKPVAVVQCGPPDEPELAFQPTYWQLVRQTNGSLHTLEDDLRDPSAIPENTWVRVGGHYYRFRRGRFVSTDFVQRPEKVLFFWLGKKK